MLGVEKSEKTAQRSFSGELKSMLLSDVPPFTHDLIQAIATCHSLTRLSFPFTSRAGLILVKLCSKFQHVVSNEINSILFDRRADIQKKTILWLKQNENHPLSKLYEDNSEI